MSSDNLLTRLLSAFYAFCRYMHSAFVFWSSNSVDIEAGQRTSRPVSKHAENVMRSVSRVTTGSDSSSFHCEDLGSVSISPPHPGARGPQAQSDADKEERRLPRQTLHVDGASSNQPPVVASTAPAASMKETARSSAAASHAHCGKFRAFVMSLACRSLQYFSPASAVAAAQLVCLKHHR